MNYREIGSAAGLAEVLQARRPVLFFKHSITCGVSTRAFKEFQQYMQAPESILVDNCLIVIQAARDVSSELARLTGVRHESPQAIIVKEGSAVWNESHLALKCETLIEAVRRISRGNT